MSRLSPANRTESDIFNIAASCSSLGRSDPPPKMASRQLVKFF